MTRHLPLPRPGYGEANWLEFTKRNSAYQATTPSSPVERGTAADPPTVAESRAPTGELAAAVVTELRSPSERPGS